jgi:hypothetical protein
MVRVDFGVKIEIDTSKMIPDKETKLSKKSYAVGSIIYDDDLEGVLYYIKTTMIDDLPEDVKGYKRKNPDFPDQSTLDQFFDEFQFEAYRELGFQIGKLVG